MPMIPMYQPQGDSIGQLLLRQGDIAARGAERSGEIWGGLTQQLGQIGGQALQQHLQAKDEQKKKAFFSQAIASYDPADPLSTYRKLAVLDPKMAGEVMRGLGSLEKPAYDQKSLEFIAKGVQATRKVMGAEIFDSQIAPGIIAQHGKKFEAAGLPMPPPEKLGAWLDELMAPPSKTATEGVTLGTGQVRFDANGKQIAIGPAKTPDAPPPGSMADYLSATPERKAEIEAATKKLAESRHVTVNVGGGTGTSDVKETIAGMKDGSLPPLMPGRATKDYTALLAEAHRQGYDLASANVDWLATTKHLATLNGSQQTRLRQAVDTATHSLDVIEELAKKWQGGKFPALNKAKLAAAKGGALGPEYQALATQLEAQISDVTSELGNVYMGGNSPTDHALGLAAKNLSADWSLPQLQAALDLSRKNLKIRANSMVNVGVAGASADNPYAAPAAPSGASAPEPKRPSSVPSGARWNPTTQTWVM